VFSVIGRREIHIKWQPPDVISGRLTRYELFCNGRCIYSGTDQEYHATMLKSDTEYSMEVIVITNEGRFRSRPAKARTLKDECLYNLVFFNNEEKIILSYLDNTSHRHSLYEPPPQSSLKNKRTEIVHPLHSAGTNNTTSKVSPSKDQRLVREGK
jgi:hypothetical protein